jgi:uncharacterized protein YdaU (DUF1376 family)
VRAAFWWIDRWRQSEAYKDFTPAQRGMYRDLIDEIWVRKSHVIPDDDRILGLIVGSESEWKANREVILAKFKRADGGWTHEVALEVIEESERRAKKQQDYRTRKAGNGAGNAIGNESGNASGDDPGNKPTSISLLSTVSNTNGVSPSNELRLTAQAPKPKPANWVGEACQIWEAIGTPNAGRIGKALKPLVDKHGWEAVKPVWQLECGSKTTESARFFSPQKFAETFAVSLKAFQERQPERKRETWSEMRARLDAAGVGA